MAGRAPDDRDDRPWADRDPFRPERPSWDLSRGGASGEVGGPGGVRGRGLQRYRMLLIMLAAFVVIGVVKGVFNRVDTKGAKEARFVVFSDVLAQQKGKPRIVPGSVVVPAGGGEGRPLLLLLAGRDQDVTMLYTSSFYAALAQLESDAPDIAVLALDRDSQAHDRSDAKWGTMVLDEGIAGAVQQTGADPKRVAVGGFGMGGFGALDLARLHPRRFCAVGAHSPELWPSFGLARPGAFDDAADFQRHDVLGAAKAGAYPDAGPMRIDVGVDDPQRPAVVELAKALRAEGRSVDLHDALQGHDSPKLWQAQGGNLLRWYAQALKGCTGRG